MATVGLRKPRTTQKNTEKPIKTQKKPRKNPEKAKYGPTIGLRKFSKNPEKPRETQKESSIA